MTLLEFLLSLIGSDAEDLKLQQDFAKDPAGTLHAVGLADLSADDVHDALVLIQDNDTTSFDRSYDTGGNHLAAFTQLPPPAHHEAAHHEAGSAAEYISKYVTNTATIDGDTTEDHSTNQVVDTDGGNFHQDVDTQTSTASGAGAVSAGDDIDDSTVVSGDGNVLGNSNVTGDGSTTAYGNGAATSTNVDGDLTTGAGSAFATGGPASVDNSDHSVHDSNNVTSDSSVHDSGNDSSDNSVHDSGNLDYSFDGSVHDSGNSTVDASQTDVGNTDVHIGDVTVTL